MAEQMDQSDDAGLVILLETSDLQKDDETHCPQDFRQSIM